MLFTTRDPDLADQYETVGHEVFMLLESGEARELLLQTSGILRSQWQSQSVAADTVVSLLGRHTLAIIQAGAYVRSTKTAELSAYPVVFERRKQEVLKSYSKQRTSTYASVHATFEVSAELLRQSQELEDRDALHLLSLLAFINYNGHSEEIFEDAVAYAQSIKEEEIHEKEGETQPLRLTKSIVENLTSVPTWRKAPRAEKHPFLRYGQLRCGGAPLRIKVT